MEFRELFLRLWKAAIGIVAARIGGGSEDGKRDEGENSERALHESGKCLRR